eukprot:gene2125-21882_t
MVVDPSAPAAELEASFKLAFAATGGLSKSGSTLGLPPPPGSVPGVG